MTDNEIIKALECCSTPRILDCENCPYSHDYSCEVLERDALDLINRQKAEIERKDRILESYALQHGTATDKEVLLRQAKAEAVREFADKIERYIDAGHLRPPTELCLSELDVVGIVNRLAKVMTEEQP